MTSGAFADVVCEVCHLHISEDMSLMVDLEGRLTVVCFKCEQQNDEGVDDDDND